MVAQEHQVELSKEFYKLVSSLVIQKQEELSRDQSQRRKKIMNDDASKGFSIPSGNVHGEFHDLQEESIRRRSEIVWSALEQTLEAFGPSFDPELAPQLHSLAESYFPLALCEPQDYLGSMGWKHPHAEKANQQKRSQLEMARLSSLNALKTKIDLYVTKKQSNLSAMGRPLTISIIFVAADPVDATRLRLGQEFREIQEQLQRSKFRDRFRLELPNLSYFPQLNPRNQPQFEH
jgi:hypothetical protein